MDQIPPKRALIGWKPIAQMSGVTMRLHSPQPPFKKSKKSLEQPKKHAPKTKMQAFVRRQKLIKGLMEGREIKDVAQTLGLSEKTAVNQASLMLMEPQTQATFIRCMEQAGLTDNFLAAKVYSLINAKKVEYFQKDGIVTDQREVEALETQRKTLELAAKLKGHLKEQSQGDINIGLMQMVVAAVKGEE